MERTCQSFLSKPLSFITQRTVKEVTPREEGQKGKGAERDQVSSFICSRRLTDGPARASGEESSE